ncbi:hypothetical protein FPV67DRAFT_1665204 [Lyophyllum atratum]|nr:hypothetical protein FPV67DRAFT_1665204 [Lyophyllum atratum]
MLWLSIAPRPSFSLSLTLASPKLYVNTTASSASASDFDIGIDTGSDMATYHLTQPHLDDRQYTPLEATPTSQSTKVCRRHRPTSNMVILAPPSGPGSIGDCSPRPLPMLSLRSLADLSGVELAQFAKSPLIPLAFVTAALVPGSSFLYISSRARYIDFSQIM